MNAVAARRGEDARCAERFAESLARAPERRSPFRHWVLDELLPSDVIGRVAELPFGAPDLNGQSGTRELHNEQRRYFDREAIEAFPVCAEVADAFRSWHVVETIERVTGASLDGTFLRIEFAQDSSGFWLRPHTDLGVKQFTLLCYVAPDARPELGTDVYHDAQRWACRIPFRPGVGLAFVPADNTWHGFEPRIIGGVRKSLIVNFVSRDWRARDQLAFDEPVVTRRVP